MELKLLKHNLYREYVCLWYVNRVWPFWPFCLAHWLRRKVDILKHYMIYG